MSDMSRRSTSYQFTITPARCMLLVAFVAALFRTATAEQLPHGSEAGTAPQCDVRGGSTGRRRAPVYCSWVSGSARFWTGEAVPHPWPLSPAPPFLAPKGGDRAAPRPLVRLGNNELDLDEAPARGACCYTYLRVIIAIIIISCCY